MSISVTNSAHRISLASEFIMARRPVVDREQNLVAHELLFCETGTQIAPCATGEEHPTAASVIADVCQHGMERIIGDLFAILYIDADALMSDIFQFLPAQNVILEIAEIPDASDLILERMNLLRQAGFRFALVINDNTPALEKLLPLVEGVRIDITGKSRDELSRFCRTFHAHQKQLLAERVETREQFQTCFELGFDFFQGYYFTEPQTQAESVVLPSQAVIAELVTLLDSDADTSVIEDRIKADVALGLNLLRLANTSNMVAHPVESLRQAVMVLGRDRLLRWLQSLPDTNRGMQHPGMMPLLAQATLRGRLMELIALKLIPGNRSMADTGFTVGVMSLMDAIFSTPMDKIVREIPVIEEIRDALLHRQGYFGQLLALVEYAEWRTKTDVQLMQAARNLKLSCSDLYQLQLSAFEWCDEVRRDAH
ncbi:MAG TPA: EAL domain-containing protein [Noviherbaspirillum sp.]|nr:EAL domain-containing protein [Noviherbaspirillum sp.]